MFFCFLNDLLSYWNHDDLWWANTRRRLLVHNLLCGALIGNPVSVQTYHSKALYRRSFYFFFKLWISLDLWNRYTQRLAVVPYNDKTSHYGTMDVSRSRIITIYVSDLHGVTQGGSGRHHKTSLSWGGFVWISQPLDYYCQRFLQMETPQWVDVPSRFDTDSPSFSWCSRALQQRQITEERTSSLLASVQPAYLKQVTGLSSSCSLR